VVSTAAVQQFTMNSVPLSAFSGRPPSAGGLKRGSRQVPVHKGLGSILALACVSLYVTSVRKGVASPSVLLSHRVFQKGCLNVRHASVLLLIQNSK